ncbi:protein of unknown function [Burkholderia sp. GAS332]|nr:protein of unknown function [Burkholderia sp. GAS332]
MSNVPRLNVIAWHAVEGDEPLNVLKLANDADLMSLVDGLGGIERIELHFPHFTDGRAYSQAYLLRRRLGFTGDLRATGDVQIDQILQIARTGFSSAVLNEGLDPAEATRHLARYSGFYQRDLAGA